MGNIIGVIGLGLCVILCGFGSCIGLLKTGSAAAGVLSEKPKLFGKVMLLVLLPATQGIYGFVLGVIGSGSIGALTVAEGWRLLASCLPLTIVGFASAIFQGKCAVSCIYTIAKEDSLSGKLLLFPAMIEFYAILSLVISIMII